MMQEESHQLQQLVAIRDRLERALDALDVLDNLHVFDVQPHLDLALRKLDTHIAVLSASN